MLKKVNKSAFKEKYKDERWYTLFHDVDFLEIQETSFKLKQVHFVYEEKEDEVLFFSAMERDKDLVMPGQFLRTGLYVKPHFSDLKTNKLLICLIAELKEIYNNITLYFTTNLTDIRPFSWAGFDVTLAYTNVKILPSEGYNSNINRLLKKDFSKFELSINDNIDKVVTKHTADLKKFKHRGNFVVTVSGLFKRLIASDYMIDINYKINDEIIASILVLIDKKTNTAYTQLISTSSEYYKYGIHAKIYHETFVYLENLGIKYVDLYGADIEGFAMFKLKFNVETKPYFRVSFNKRKAILNNYKIKAKLIIKDFLIKIGEF